MPKDLARRLEQIEARIKDTTVSLNPLSLSNSDQILRSALDGFIIIKTCYYIFHSHAVGL